MKILVILAAYNGAKYIEEQMDSILNQDSVSLDIMVFDDCSTDNTIEVLNKYKSNVNVSINKREKGTGNAPRCPTRGLSQALAFLLLWLSLCNSFFRALSLPVNLCVFFSL